MIICMISEQLSTNVYTNCMLAQRKYLHDSVAVDDVVRTTHLTAVKGASPLAIMNQPEFGASRTANVGKDK